MRTYRITLTGKTPLLMHYDDVRWADLGKTAAVQLALPEHKALPKRPMPAEGEA